MFGVSVAAQLVGEGRGRGEPQEALRALLGGAADGAQTERVQAGVGDAGADGGPARVNQRWSVDFACDGLVDRRRFPCALRDR